MMNKFKKVTKPIALDFYTIYMMDGVKYIHVFGYTYKSDSLEYVSEENPNGVYWANMMCCGFSEPLSEFVTKYKEETGNHVDDTYCECKQYQGDYDEEGIINIINHYFDGKPADYYLPFSEITEDTPCGNYVC